MGFITWPHLPLVSPPTPASYLVCQRWLWFPTQTGLFLTSELCCPPALDASLDSTNSFLLFLGLRSGVLLTTVRCSSSLLPEHLCLPLSTEIKASPRLFSHVSLLGVQLYWCVTDLCQGRFPLGIFPLAHDSLWGPSRHPYRAASPLLRQGFDGLQSGTDIPFRAWCSCVTQSGGNPSRVTLLSPLLGKSSWFSQDRGVELYSFWFNGWTVFSSFWVYARSASRTSHITGVHSHPPGLSRDWGRQLHVDLGSFYT